MPKLGPPTGTFQFLSSTDYSASSRRPAKRCRKTSASREFSSTVVEHALPGVAAPEEASTMFEWHSARGISAPEITSLIRVVRRLGMDGSYLLVFANSR